MLKRDTSAKETCEKFLSDKFVLSTGINTPPILFILLLVIVGLLYLFKEPTPKILPLINRIVIEKQQRKMIVYHQNQPIKEYKIVLGSQPIGPKERQGDGKTPEGTYKIVSKNVHSRFHRSLKISYPNNDDQKRALKNHVSCGNDIMIHGIQNGLGWIGRAHLFIDWTKGCIAVTNPEIDEIFKSTPIGTPVEIRP